MTKSAHQLAISMAESRGALRGLQTALVTIDHHIQAASGAALVALVEAQVGVGAACAGAQRTYDAAATAWETACAAEAIETACARSSLLMPDLSMLPAVTLRTKRAGCRRVR